MGNEQIDYDALARQHGGNAVIDYDALAKQHGGSAAAVTGGEKIPTAPTGSAASRGAGAFLSDLAGAASGAIEQAGQFSGMGPLVSGVKEFLNPGQAEAKAKAAEDAKKVEREERKASGYPAWYRALAEVAPFVGVNVKGMEDAAKQGDTAAVVGHTVLPAALAAAPVVKEVAGPKVAELQTKFAAERNAKYLSKANDSLGKAIPATKSNPYTPKDVETTRAYIEDEHHAGGGTVTSVEGYRDAADSAIGKIEKHVDELIAHNPTDTIGGHADLEGAVKKALQGNVTKGFLDRGLQSLKEKYNFSDDMTVADAKKLIRQLNDDNQAFMKARNNYERANLRNTNPAFAAREALAAELRNGIFNKLESRGMPGVRELRQDQGSLIKMRNAAEAKIHSGEAKVGGTEAGGPIRRAAGRVFKMGSIAKGAAVAGPEGAVIGAEVGEIGKQAIAPGNKTRNQLVAESFRRKLTPGAAGRFPALGPRPSISGSLGAGAVVTPQPGASVQTPAEVSAAAAAQKSAQTPSVRIERDPATGKMRKVYLNTGGGERLYGESGKTSPNASGESAASQEAINRAKAEQSAGVKRFRIDTRSGKETPIVGVDAVDARPGAHEVIVQRGPKGETVLDRGAQARPYSSKGAAGSGAGSKIEFTTDFNGTTWAKRGNGTPVSIPKSIGEDFREAYAAKKLDEYGKMESNLGNQPTTAKEPSLAEFLRKKQTEAKGEKYAGPERRAPGNSREAWNSASAEAMSINEQLKNWPETLMPKQRKMLTDRIAELRKIQKRSEGENQ